MGTTTSKARMSVVDLGGAVLHILLFSHSCQSVTVTVSVSPSMDDFVTSM